MQNNLYAFVEGKIVFLIAEKVKLEVFNLMGNKQVRIVELLPEMEVQEHFIGNGFPNVKYILFQNVEKTEYFYWILEYPDELTYKQVLGYFQDTEPDCDNDGSNLVNPDYSND